jgi:hypothetical protein
VGESVGYAEGEVMKQLVQELSDWSDLYGNVEMTDLQEAHGMLVGAIIDAEERLKSMRRELEFVNVLIVHRLTSEMNG